MYEYYTRQSLPSREYRELLGSAICVFNSNNAFIIENVLEISRDNYNWHGLIDLHSGALKGIVKDTISQKTDMDIAGMFSELVEMRNRIVHSFQVTSQSGEQILRTKDKQHRQYNITEAFLMEFIRKNEELCDMLHELRGYS
ncbi:MAG: selenium binding protein [Christensenellales bacterium]|jgi:hypothetical protein